MQRSIEILIGRLVTDEEFREAFKQDPHALLRDADAWGLSLTAVEVSALLGTDQSLWDQIADALDARLQKSNLKNP